MTGLLPFCVAVSYYDCLQILRAPILFHKAHSRLCLSTQGTFQLAVRGHVALLQLNHPVPSHAIASLPIRPSNPLVVQYYIILYYIDLYCTVISNE